MIRAFQNADLPSVSRLWVEHHAAFGPPPAIGTAVFEQATVSRIFFDREWMLVATDGESPVAFVHAFAGIEDPSSVTIAALCGRPGPDQVATLTSLLENIHLQAFASGYHSLRLGLLGQNHFGYAGLDPIGLPVGIMETDLAASEAAERSRFSSGPSWQSLSVSTLGFRPPVDRELIQFRRTTQTSWGPRLFDDPAAAAMHAHLDIETVDLLARDGNVLGRQQVWTSDAEAAVMAGDLALLPLSDQPISPAEVHLICMVIQSIAPRPIARVETALPVASAETIETMERIGFRIVRSGRRWTRELS